MPFVCGEHGRMVVVGMDDEGRLDYGCKKCGLTIRVLDPGKDVDPEHDVQLDNRPEVSEGAESVVAENEGDDDGVFNPL